MTTYDDDRPGRRPRSLKLVLGTAATVVVLAGAGSGLGAARDDLGDSDPGHRFPGGVVPPDGGGDPPDPAA